MNLRPAIGCLAALSLSLLPVAAFGQSVNVTRSILANEPYTLIYPGAMTAAGGDGQPLTINHPDTPLQFDLTVVAVDDTGWTPESALASLVDADIVAGWSETFPSFALGTKSITAFQSGPALMYEGTSTESPQGVPLTIVHTETVDNGRGYALDCLFATEYAEQTRPLVDFIIANFSTRSDAECCIGVVAEDPATAPAAQ